MRTYEEIHADILAANSSTDTAVLRILAKEMLQLNTPNAEAIAANVQGIVHHNSSEYPEALVQLRRALTLHEELGDRVGVARVTRNIGALLKDTGDYIQSLEHLLRAKIFFEQNDDKRGAGIVINDIGNVYKAKGDYNQALKYFQHALTLSEETAHRTVIAATTGNIGTIHFYTGKFPLALESWHRSLALYRELNDRSGVARTTGNIGNLYAAVGNYPEALEHYHRSVDAHKGFGERSEAAMVTTNLGLLLVQTGNYSEALAQLHNALAFYEEISDAEGVARASMNIGNLYCRVGNFPNALENLDRALALYEDIGNPKGVAETTGNIGNVYAAMGDHPLALKKYRHAAAYFKEQGSTKEEVTCAVNILNTLIETGDYANTEQLFATIDSMQIDAIWEVIERENIRASIQEHNEKLDDAMKTLRNALATAQEHTLPSLQTDILKHLRDLCQKRNDFAGYIEHNNEFLRITEEVNGKDTATKLAMQHKQREIDAERKETEKHIAVLHSTLPKHIADRVARGEVVNDRFNNAAVMFLDIVGFTNLSSELSSEHVIKLLDDVFKICDEACKQHGVTRVKTIGDSYLAVGGLEDEKTRGLEDEKTSGPVERIANAALQIIEKVRQFNFQSLPVPSSISQSLPVSPSISQSLHVRIGLHCGPVTAGVLGTERLQYDVWGDTVNVASRMESTSEPSRIHVSEQFKEALDNVIAGREAPDLAPGTWHLVLRGETEVKGKGPLTTYWLESVST